MGNLTTPPSVQKLQRAYMPKPRENPGSGYLLYDKMHRADVLEYAYRCCKANKGAAGVDGQRFKDIEKYGEGRWLGELAARLRSKTCEPQAVKRVWLPNSSKMRPLGAGAQGYGAGASLRGHHPRQAAQDRRGGAAQHAASAPAVGLAPSAQARLPHSGARVGAVDRAKCCSRHVDKQRGKGELRPGRQTMPSAAPPASPTSLLCTRRCSTDAPRVRSRIFRLAPRSPA